MCKALVPTVEDFTSWCGMKGMDTHNTVCEVLCHPEVKEKYWWSGGRYSCHRSLLTSENVISLNDSQELDVQK